jgi:hypothetical protein
MVGKIEEGAFTQTLIKYGTQSAATGTQTNKTEIKRGFLKDGTNQSREVKFC